MPKPSSLIQDLHPNEKNETSPLKEAENPPLTDTQGATAFASAGEPPESEGMSRRELLRVTAGAAISLPWLASCGPSEEEKKRQEEEKKRLEEEKKRLEEEKKRLEEEARQNKLCETDPSVDKAQEVSFAPDKISQKDDLFVMAVQAGVMTTTGALLWTYATDNKPKRLRVWRKSTKDGMIMQVLEKEVTPKDGYFHETIDGLAAGVRYWYAFFDGTADAPTARSRIGSFKTSFPKDCKQPLVIAGTACTNAKKYDSFPSLLWMAEQDFDLLCHLGDMSYNDGATTQDEYRKSWLRTLKTPGYPELFAKAGMYATWDDHETVDNSSFYKKTAEHRRTALDAYRESVALPRRTDNRLWESFRWGLTAEVFVLDSRGERQPDTRLTDNPIYLGREQMDWLKKAIKDSPCHFKILLNSVPIIQWTDLWKAAGVDADRWEGYPKQRLELLDHILAEKIRNVWFLSGDLHVGVVARVEADGPRSKIWEILVGPGGNDNPLGSVFKNGDEHIKESIAPARQFLHFGAEHTGTILTFDPRKDEVSVRFVEGSTKKVIFEKTLKQEPL